MECLLANQIRSDPREIPFIKLLELPIQKMGHRTVQDTVSKEFETFVVRCAMTTVCQCEP